MLFLWNFLGKISSAVDFDCERICQIAVCNGAAKNQRDFQYQYIHAALDRSHICGCMVQLVARTMVPPSRPVSHPFTTHRISFGQCQCV